MWRSVVVAALLVVCGHAAYTSFDFGPSHADYGILQLAALRNNSHNLIIGWRQYGDRLLHRQKVYQSSRLFRVVTATVTYPVPGTYPRPANITAVYAIDLKNNGNGATANLTAGGVGLPTVSIRFKSQRGHGIDSLVEIYGK